MKEILHIMLDKSGEKPETFAELEVWHLKVDFSLHIAMIVIV